MGIYIEGMEMPSGLAERGFVIRGDGRVRTFTGVVIDYATAISVTPNRDLIDRKYAIATACSGRIRAFPTTENGEDWIRVNEVRESIKSAPTVIKVESEE